MKYIQCQCSYMIYLLISEHFTQIVWKKTNKIGISTIYAGTDLIIVVIYDPKGNVKEKFTENLNPPQIKLKVNL